MRFGVALPDTDPGRQIQQIIRNIATGEDENLDSASERCTRMAELLLSLRSTLARPESSGKRLPLMELSLDLEAMLFKEAALWLPSTAGELLEKVRTLTNAIAGCGLIEMWERKELISRLTVADSVTSLTPFAFSLLVRDARRAAGGDLGARLSR